MADAISRALDQVSLAVAAVLILGAVAVLWWIRVTSRRRLLRLSRAAVQAAVDEAQCATAPPLPARCPVVKPSPVAAARPARPIGVLKNTAVWVSSPRRGAVAHRSLAGQTPEGTPVVLRDENGKLLGTYGMLIPAEMGVEQLHLRWCLLCFPPVIPGAGHRVPGRRSAS